MPFSLPEIRAGVASGVRVQRARPGGRGRWGLCSLETRGSLGKSLFFLSLTTPTSSGSFSPVTIATPFVIRGVNFQHFFAPRTEPAFRPEIDRMMAPMGWRADADVAELVDALDLGSSAERRGGSSPFIRTTLRSSSFGWQAL